MSGAHLAEVRARIEARAAADARGEPPGPSNVRREPLSPRRPLDLPLPLPSSLPLLAPAAPCPPTPAPHPDLEELLTLAASLPAEDVRLLLAVAQLLPFARLRAECEARMAARACGPRDPNDWTPGAPGEQRREAMLASVLDALRMLRGQR